MAWIAISDPEQFRDRRCPGGPRDAPAEPEDEDFVQYDIRTDDHEPDHERYARAPDAVEVGDGRPERRSERPADHARDPELDRERLDLRRQAEALDHRGAECDVRPNAGIVSTDAHMPIQAIWLVRR